MTPVPSRWLPGRELCENQQGPRDVLEHTSGLREVDEPGSQVTALLPRAGGGGGWGAGPGPLVCLLPSPAASPPPCAAAPLRGVWVTRGGERPKSRQQAPPGCTRTWTHVCTNRATSHTRATYRHTGAPLSTPTRTHTWNVHRHTHLRAHSQVHTVGTSHAPRGHTRTIFVARWFSWPFLEGRLRGLPRTGLGDPAAAPDLLPR